MPISIDAYQSGLTPEDSEFMAIFDKQPYQAYDIEDILKKGGEPWINVSSHATIYFRLQDLKKRGLLQSKWIGWHEYFVSSKAV